MRFNCSVVEDLLPLYLEDMCSMDSRAALEEHLRECPACRKKMERMKNSEIIPQIEKKEGEPPITEYAKKVRRHQIRVGILVTLICAAAACLLALCALTVFDMHRSANPAVFLKEAGVFDLTAAELETTAAQVGEYLLFTNTQRIQVTVQRDADFEGEILLWDDENKDGPILFGHVDAGNNTCVFDKLSAAQRYRVTCGGNEQAAVTVSDGRTVSFWSSLGNVLKELIRI